MWRDVHGCYPFPFVSYDCQDEGQGFEDNGRLAMLGEEFVTPCASPQQIERWRPTGGNHLCQMGLRRVALTVGILPVKEMAALKDVPDLSRVNLGTSCRTA